MIEKKEDKYPMAHDVVKIHPKAGNIGKKCLYCTKKNPKNLIDNSTTTKMVLHYDNEHGWRIYSSIMDVVASNYSDDDVYLHTFSDKIEFCPKCSRKLV
jgi:hypothetical protein